MSDPMARTVAENAITDLLERTPGQDRRTDACAIVGRFDAHLEHRDGLRRVVLTGEWEVEPRP